MAEKPTLKARLLGEMRKVLLATVYFLVGFNLLAVLIGLLAPGEPGMGEMVATASVLALVVGKVVVLAEGPIERVVRRGGSFLGAVAQRAAWFTLAVFVALALEAVLHGVIGDGLSLQAAFEHALQESSLQRFTARALYLMVLFGLYSLLFELDGYFAPHRLVDAVTSRFESPRVAAAVTMRVGLVGPLEPAHAALGMRLVQRLYSALTVQATSLGADLDLFGGLRGVLVWPAEGFDVEQARRAYAAIEARLGEEADWWEAETGAPPQLKAVVTGGELHTVELGAGHRRQILRSGPCLERADEWFRQLNEPTLVIDPSLVSQAPPGAEARASATA